MKKGFREYLLITLGAALMAVGVYFFKFPNHFTTGGVSGISILLGYLLPRVTPAVIMAVINAALLIVALRCSDGASG